MSFAVDTAVQGRGDGRFGAVVAPGWRGPAGPHGGYLAAIILRALIAGLDDPARAPRSLTVHYPAAPADGPVEIEVRVERAGRSLATLSARMVQDERTVALALAAFSPAWPAEEWSDAVAPASPPPEEVEPLRPGPGEMPDFFARVETRPTLGGRIFGGSEEAVAGGWLRTRPAEPVDAPVAAFLLDAWWPAAFSRLDAPAAVPTIDFTVHFRRPLPWAGCPPDEPVLGAFRSRELHDGFLEEDGELWSRDGVLLAQSRQLALLVAPRASAPPGSTFAAPEP